MQWQLHIVHNAVSHYLLTNAELTIQLSTNHHPTGKTRSQPHKLPASQLYGLLYDVIWYGMTLGLIQNSSWLCLTLCCCIMKSATLPHLAAWLGSGCVPITQQQWKYWCAINIVLVEIKIKTLHVWFLSLHIGSFASVSCRKFYDHSNFKYKVVKIFFFFSKDICAVLKILNNKYFKTMFFKKRGICLSEEDIDIHLREK